MKQSRMFCEQKVSYLGDLYYDSFYPSDIQVRMCQDQRDPKPILRCVVTETQESPTCDCYWAWWDNHDQRFVIVYQNRKAVEICFPYGFKVEEERGHGTLMPVNITIIPREEA